MLRFRLCPEVVREAAADLRHVSAALDHSCWCLGRSRLRLEAEWQSLSMVEIEASLQQTIQIMSEVAEAFFQLAGVLEKATAWAEDADHYSAAAFQDVALIWSRPENMLGAAEAPAPQLPH